ncbi:PadR family transcriptional regulator [Methanocella sp. MCL-LM]|uniref:PadR family transcriptional regulator n=1 Tax=Methanocella sp. MCL-LM TaxID=3412035 RepID=UPI003C7529C6
MMPVSNAEAALLSLLCEKPMHGYEIEKTIEDRNMRYWTEISFYSIYRVLRKLEEKGLVESQLKLSKNNVSQKVYTVTEPGRVTTREKILHNLSIAERPISPVDLAVANISLLSNSEAIACLERYTSSVDGMIADYRALDDFFQANGYPDTDRALALRPLAHMKAEKAWAIEFLDMLRKRIDDDGDKSIKGI